MSRRILLTLLSLLSACGTANRAAAPRSKRVDKISTHDIVIYAASSAGVTAAVSAARRGRRVLLIARGKHVGGLSASGLGATDIGNKAAIGGLAREFYQRIRKHYAKSTAWQHERREDFRGHGHRAGEDTAWTFEPHVAELVFESMLKEAGVQVLRSERLLRSQPLALTKQRIDTITLCSGRRLRAKIFIDASYEGDLMAAAGVRYRVGREANAEFAETLNGVQTKNAKFHQFIKAVDPYIEPGNPASGLLAGVSNDGPGLEGSADARVQAYCFRICATDLAANRIPWPKPADYDPRKYEVLLRNLEAGDLRKPWNPVLMPNRKTDSNNNFAVSSDMLGANYEYPEASDARRAAIIAGHRSYQMGLYWTLAHHARVPSAIRKHFSSWGLARDEFTENGGWPYEIYVREARRMRSAYVMTEHNCRGSQQAPDSIGLAAYGMDSHNVQRYVDAQGHLRNEGDVQVHGFKPYPIAYRSVVPRARECQNLLVPVCLSATHIAFGSIRMEPVFMLLGQSVAIAADLAIERGVAVQAIEYDELRRRLLAAKQVLHWIESGDSKRH